MLAPNNVASICSKITWRAIFLSLASTSKSAGMIAAFPGGVKHCCCKSPSSLLKLFALFQLVQNFFKLVMVRVFDDQFAGTFVAWLDFHACPKMRAYLILQALCVAAEFVSFLVFFLFRLASLLLYKFFRFAHRELFHHDLICQ